MPFQKHKNVPNIENIAHIKEIIIGKIPTWLEYIIKTILIARKKQDSVIAKTHPPIELK